MNDEIILEKMPEWIHALTPEAFFEVARARPPGLGKDPKFLDLQRAMRAMVPVPGDTWVHDIDVLIEPHQGNHQGQRWHDHPEWTCIYYVDPGDPAVPIRIRTEVEIIEITPEAGDCLVMPPDLEHRVANSDSTIPRLSFAMLVPVPGRRSKYVN